mmetsp:Transcript_106638/g.183875  ORF Transcript_106638/g.183875 Transcript_106638/m.183875 type:complete len:280 (-) Transcript_106638:704-1543(-)
MRGELLGHVVHDVDSLLEALLCLVTGKFLRRQVARLLGEDRSATGGACLRVVPGGADRAVCGRGRFGGGWWLGVVCLGFRITTARSTGLQPNIDPPFGTANGLTPTSTTASLGLPQLLRMLFFQCTQGLSQLHHFLLEPEVLRIGLLQQRVRVLSRVTECTQTVLPTRIDCRCGPAQSWKQRLNPHLHVVVELRQRERFCLNRSFLHQLVNCFNQLWHHLKQLLKPLRFTQVCLTACTDLASSGFGLLPCVLQSVVGASGLLQLLRHMITHSALQSFQL